MRVPMGVMRMVVVIVGMGVRMVHDGNVIA